MPKHGIVLIVFMNNADEYHSLLAGKRMTKKGRGTCYSTFYIFVLNNHS
ncbi:hypothetical protein GNIT_2914 [Glaciecola nitratireducens FR1064]|uniref:Uncharacterized protein n=1 Tax=Glaciecola nitratireducens (strain JCM 12485 / KCTC 12276 / FR1064) TaxID=1085623 RepID=G4QMS7_GLANF|nr:hypothetical protein GNIT_2914 [Glaciecola nitratireducens FR1064]